MTTPAVRRQAVERRTELAAFLRSRRERIGPEDVGLPPGHRRRTSGLRREEVAQLAGVGVTWYTWLEQGRPINASTQVLDSIARTLKLDPVERTSSGHRRFDEDDLDWLEVLRCLRDTGMPIAQMCRYAELARGGEATFAERLGLLAEHDAAVQERIAVLQAQREHLQEKIGWYRRHMEPAHSG